MLRPISVLLFAFLLASCESVPEKLAPAMATASAPVPASAALTTAGGLDTLEKIAAQDWPEPQRTFKGYRSKGQPAHWNLIYKDGGTEVYCRTNFSKSQASNRRIGTRELNVEHAYPAHWIAKRYGCRNRNECPKDAYRYAEADLHNLWPSYSSVNSSRGNRPFGEIPTEENRQFEEFCPDYERISDPQTVEPDDRARGDFARSIFYMHHVYGVPFADVVDSPARLLAWHKKDPPDSKERERETLIRESQHTWNPLVMPKGPEM